LSGTIASNVSKQFFVDSYGIYKRSLPVQAVSSDPLWQGKSKMSIRHTISFHV
jgi:hypothetical protein